MPQNYDLLEISPCTLRSSSLHDLAQCPDVSILLGLPSLYIVTDLINALPGNGSVNTVQHATIEQRRYATRL
jgi:hypothetical protein